MNEDQFRAYLKKQVQAAHEGSQAAAARAWGVSPQFLSDVLAGRRNGGPKLAAKLGFSKRVAYVR